MRSERELRAALRDGLLTKREYRKLEGGSSLQIKKELGKKGAAKSRRDQSMKQAQEAAENVDWDKVYDEVGKSAKQTWRSITSWF